MMVRKSITKKRTAVRVKVMIHIDAEDAIFLSMSI